MKKTKVGRRRARSRQGKKSERKVRLQVVPMRNVPIGGAFYLNDLWYRRMPTMWTFSEGPDQQPVLRAQVNAFQVSEGAYQHIPLFVPETKEVGVRPRFLIAEELDN